MRITALFLAMMMALFLTACSGDNDSGKAASGDKASTSAPAKAAPAKAYNPDDDQDGDC